MHPATEFRALSADDLEQVMSLLAETEGVSAGVGDSVEALTRYLDRNSGLCVAAVCGENLVGFVLCGHDGRRGYLHHLVVRPGYRGRGIARELVSICISALEGLGIRKAHIDVFVSNERARAVWEKLGWAERTDIARYSYTSSLADDP